MADVEINDDLEYADFDVPADVSEPLKKGYVRVFLDEPSNAGEPERQFMQINGKSFSVLRGIEVDVPRELIGVMRDAVETKFSQDSRGNLVPRHVPRISFRIIKVA